MPTQIASTPVIKGPEAVKIYNEAHREPSKQAETGKKILAEMFDKFIK